MLAANSRIAKICMNNHHIDHHADFPSRHVLPRRVDVWLPPGYDASAETGYGVLYMHDGQNLFDPELSYTGVSWGVAEALEGLNSAETVPPTIIVGVWNTERRWQEYIPQRPFDAPGGRRAFQRHAFNLGTGTVYTDRYLRFLVEELKPFIDSRYRTLPDQPNTTIMGSSMGGLVSLYALCEYPDVFGAAGCLSTHWPAVEGVIEAYLSAALPDPRRHQVYFDYGTEGLDALYEPHQRRIDAIMRQAGYAHGDNWMTQRFDGAAHNEAAWRERVHMPLQFLLR